MALGFLAALGSILEHPLDRRLRHAHTCSRTL